MSNELATQPERRDLRQLVQSDKIKEQLMLALPKHYSADQFAVIIRTAINKNPKLQECTQESFLVAVLTAAQMGIAPDGRNGHLLPVFNKKTQSLECQFRADYKGIVSLVRKAGNVADVYAEPVYSNDTFRITKGLHRDLIHEVDYTQDQGEFIGAYAVISYKDGTASSFDFMPKREIEGIRARSQSPDFGPWKTDYSEMAKKTVLRRLLKLADLTPETHDQISHDNELPEITISPAAVPLPPAQREALPERAQAALPERTPAVEAAAELPQEKPKAAPKKNALTPEKTEKPAQATELTLEATEPTDLEKILKKLQEAGKTPEQLIAGLVKSDAVKPGTTMEGLTDKNKAMILQYWDDALDLMTP